MNTGYPIWLVGFETVCLYPSEINESRNQETGENVENCTNTVRLYFTTSNTFVLSSARNPFKLYIVLHHTEVSRR